MADPTLSLRHGALTDVGRKREHNEDNFFVDPERRLYVVADGMGGHAAGEVASRIAVETIDTFIRREGEETLDAPVPSDDTLTVEENQLQMAIALANQRILEAGQKQKDLQGMGTTLVAVMVRDTAMTIAHVGDSRAYLVRDGGITLMTSDHSWVNEQVRLGLLTQTEAAGHPFRNVITRALGGKEQVQVEFSRHELRPDDAVLLCSDGLNTMVPDDQILRITQVHLDDPDQAAGELVATANEQGGEDNVTVVVVRAETAEATGD